MSYGVEVRLKHGLGMTPERRTAIERFLAAFVAKKGLPPAGEWRVPGVGYCFFVRPPQNSDPCPE